MKVEGVLFRFPSLTSLALGSDIMDILHSKSLVGREGEGLADTDPIVLSGDKFSSWESFGLWFLHEKLGALLYTYIQYYI